MSYVNLCDEGLSGDFTSEEYRDYLHMIRETCIPASTYSVSRTRKQLRKQKHGRDMAQCFIFVLTCTFM